MTIDDLAHLALHLTASGLRSVSLSPPRVRRDLQMELKEDFMALVMQRRDGELTVLLWRADGRYVREVLRLPADHPVADMLPR